MQLEFLRNYNDDGTRDPDDPSANGGLISNEPRMKRDLLSVTDVERLTGYSRPIIYKLIAQGALRAIQINGYRGQYKIPRYSYENFIYGRRNKRGRAR